MKPLADTDMNWGSPIIPEPATAALPGPRPAPAPGPAPAPSNTWSAPSAIDASACPSCGREGCEAHLPPEPTDVAAAARDAHASQVALAAEQERVRREARRIVDAEEHPVLPIPAGYQLRRWLAEPDDMPDTWRVKNWMPRGARVMIAAQFKTGKTIFRDNLVRSLVDGDRFLGRDDVTPITGTVAILDFEMPPAKLKAWLKRQQIRDDDRVVAYSLRSDILSFNLLDGGARQAWAAKLRAQA